MSTIGERIRRAVVNGITKEELAVICEAYAIEQKYGLDSVRKNEKVSYQNYSGDKLDRWRLRLHDTAVFDTREEAERVLKQMHDLAYEYGAVMVNDYYELCGLEDKTSFIHIPYGWPKNDVLNMGVVRCYSGYMIDVPCAYIL